MPLFSEHIANMYYSGSSPYTSGSYSYNSLVSPLGTSYSASYLNPGGNYSNHSSLGGYSRAPLSSRWISGVGRSYSPMLSTISERTTASPIRINSPRRIPITTRTYSSSGYTSRPININTADIDVSKNKYRQKVDRSTSKVRIERRDSGNRDKENSPFMPRVDGKPETGIDSSPGIHRSTIKRGRTVVRLHTLKRKERDSPRKPVGSLESQDAINSSEKSTDDKSHVTQESLSWRERLSDDLIYKDKKEKKTLGTKLVEKFTLKDVNSKTLKDSVSEQKHNESEKLLISQIPGASKSLDRRCSMELLAEQAKLLDSLIRKENLSTATLDLSKVGTDEIKKQSSALGKRRKSNDQEITLKTTKSDHSLHEKLKSVIEYTDEQNTNFKRRSLKKSLSSGNIFRLDSITEFPKEPINIDLPSIEEIRHDSIIKKPKPNLKTKITSSVEVSTPLKFRIENVVVDEKPRSPKKEIRFSSEVDEPMLEVVYTLNKADKPSNKLTENSKERKSTNIYTSEGENHSPEPENGNFWDKIGKRETIYLKKRKEVMDAAKEKSKNELLCYSDDFEEVDEKSERADLLPHMKENLNIEVLSKSSELDIIIPNKENQTQTKFDIICSKDIDKKNLFISEFTDSYLQDGISQTIEPLHTSEPTSHDEFLKNDIKLTNNSDTVHLNLNTEESISKTCEKIMNSEETCIINDVHNENVSFTKEKSESLPSIISDNKQQYLKTCDINLQNKQISDEINNGDAFNKTSEKVKKKKCKTVLQPKKIRGKTKPKQAENHNVIYSNDDLEVTESNIKDNNTNDQPLLHDASDDIECKTEKKSQQSNMDKTFGEEPSPIFFENSDSSVTAVTHKNSNNKSTELILNFEDSSISDSSSALDCASVDISKNQPSNNILITQVELEYENIPIIEIETKIESKQDVQNKENINKADIIPDKHVQETKTLISKEVLQIPIVATPRKPVKEQVALRPLIATPRPLQKKPPQVIHSPNSSDSSSEEDTSDEEDDSEISRESEEFFECETNIDGRTSIGSNDSGFDSSAPASPAGFLQIKKGTINLS